MALVPASAQVQSRPHAAPPDAHEPLPRRSSPGALPSWAEPNAAPDRSGSASSLPDDRQPGQPVARNNPGFPGTPEQEVPLGGGGATALLAAAGAVYGLRRLHENDDADGPSLSH